MRSLSMIFLFCAIGMMAFAQAPVLKISSPAFGNNENIPVKYTCDGEKINPPLNIANVPSGTKSLAIILHDPDAPMEGGFTHWVVWNIDPETTTIPENFHVAIQGNNSADRSGYVGMCPPKGTHHYHFRVYALNTRFDLNKQTGKDELEKNMKGHILAQGEIVGLYKKANP